MTSLTEQQHKAVFSVDKNVLVSAGAGSGKTHVLVERYIEILRKDPTLRVDGIIAVTFTRKAAGEMRTRLKERFRQLTESEQESERWRKCLAEIDSARIGTIHSLCESILKAFPAESGIDPHFEVIDEVSQAQLLEDSIDQTFREVIGDELPEIKLLGEHNIEEIRNWLKQMLAASLQFDEAAQLLLQLDSEQLLTAVNETRHRIQLRLLTDVVAKPDWKEAYAYLAETFARDKLEALRFHVVQACEQIMQQTSCQDSTACDSAEMWRKLEILAGIELRVGGHSDEAKTIKERLGVLRSIARKILGKPPLPPVIGINDLMSFEDERHLSKLFYRALKNYGESKRVDLRLDYNDLIGLAYKALSASDSEPRRHYQDHIKAILVDEFQDTNTIQAELISFLAGSDTRLFLIGDDKQSIYKFQGADVSTFNQWKDRLSGKSVEQSKFSLNGESLLTKLTVSFRSHPKVVAFVNAVFARLLAKDKVDIPYRAEFEPLSTFRKPLAPLLQTQTLDKTHPVQSGGRIVSAAIMGGAGGGMIATTMTAALYVETDSSPIIAPVIESDSRAPIDDAKQAPKQLSLFDVPVPEPQPTNSRPAPGDNGFNEINEINGINELENENQLGTKSDSASELADFAPPRPFANVQVVVFDAADDQGDRDSELSSLTESRTVAKWIDDLVSGGAPLLDNEGRVERSLKYGDFAILVPKNSNFPVIERGLSERGIPYVTFAGRGFLNRQEVIDLENLLNFLGNPQDSHALLGTLRSPLFALSDDVLHELYTKALQQSQETTLWEALLCLASTRPAGYESVFRAVSELKRFKEDAARLSLTALLRKIIQRTCYDVALMSADNGRQRARNLWKLVALARDHEDLSFAEFAQHLALMRDFELKQTDAPFASQDSVKLMTIHASKGLEFPAVVLPCLSGRILGQERKLIFHRNYGFALDTSRGDAEARPAWYRYARQLDQDMEVAERKRLLYVAMTRARDYLGVILEKDTGQQQDSFRLWLADILNIDFHAQDVAGLHQLRCDGQEAEYSIDLLDRRSVTPPRLEGACDRLANKKPSHRLLEPILPVPVSPSSSWNGWTRVTPSPGELQDKLDATTIGVFLHSVLENLPPSLMRPERETLLSLASQQGSLVAHPERLDRLVSEGEKLLDIFYGSELFELMQNAKRRWSEIPYMIMDENGLQSKRPDLLIEDQDGNWLIVDYKTDDVASDQLIRQARRHAGQLQSYARDIARLTGLSFATRLYFARHGALLDPLAAMD